MKRFGELAASKPMMLEGKGLLKLPRLAGLATGLVLLLGACAVGKRHTADSKLREHFLAHEAGFQLLLSDIESDNGLEMVRNDTLRYRGRTYSWNVNSQDAGSLPLSKARWLGYRQALKELGILQVSRNESAIEFRVDGGTVYNGDSYKGYEYSLSHPSGSMRDNLDTYRLTDQQRDTPGDYKAYSSLKNNWYIYLLVNGQ